MIEAISSIQIYNPHGYAYENGNGEVDFPITDQCERSAKVMGEDFVRLVFKLEHRVTFDAFSYIEYNGQTFFLREQYIPTPNGSIQDGSDVSSPYYSYDVKFVSVGNMLDKHVCYRYVKVNGEKTYEWYEPEININGNLETLYVIVMGAIKRIGDEYAANQMHYGTLLQSIASNGLNALGTAPNKDKVKITEGTKLLTFNFSGDNIANVCTTVANNFTNDDNKDTEWYITEEWVGNDKILTMHFAKFVSDAGEQVVSDYIKEDVGNYHFAHPYVTGGLKKVEYAQAWSGITQTIVPYGSDRNMSGQAVKGIDEITQMQSMFGKRLRLDPNTSYNVKDKDGNVVVITTDHNAAIENNYVNTGIEQVKFYDDIYPQGHFKITKVEVKNKRQEGETIPEYTIEAKPIDSNGNDIEAPADGFYPIKIEEGTTLSVRFEKGMLSGREFEIANKTRKDEGKTTYSLKFTIVADGSIEDGTLIPSGNFKPYENDEFALFNMKMPEVYVEQAKQELAQKAYDELVELQTTRPEVKCTTDPVNFAGEMALGNVYRVSSEKFNSEHTFVSRVISYSYKLTKTNDIQFSLASAIMQGTLSSMNDMIADVTHATGGLEQRAINLSRRAWRDASEVAEMIDSITTEMMLVGNEKNQFVFTMGIECVDASNKFSYLEIGYGSIQHSQEPYIDYANNGWWEVGTTRLSRDEVGQDLNPDLAYYLYAKVDESTTAQMVLSVDDNSSNEAYLLLGILSSEFEGKRVFSRTNGFTAIEGGTITTEQIQDAGRNLIIDFQSKTPRIIARNGAEIVGNIKFLSAVDENGNDVLKTLADLGIDVSGLESGLSAEEAARKAAIEAEKKEREDALKAIQEQVAAEEEARTEAIAGLKDIQDSLQAQIDGEVTSWFMNGEPTLSNKPVTDWQVAGNDAETEKNYQRHEGDTYTDISEITLLTSDMWEQGGLTYLSNSYKGKQYDEQKTPNNARFRSKYLLDNKPNSVVYVPSGYNVCAMYYDTEGKYLGSYSDNDVSFVLTQSTSSGLTISKIAFLVYKKDATELPYTIADELKLSINPTAGQSWRWCNIDDEYGTGWHWHKIADSDAVKALQEAGKAQATADGKSTIFTIQPSNYSVGDMWVLAADTTVNGTTYKKGTILNANYSSATYVASHWTEKVKYTDDTAVLNLEIGGRNLLAKVGQYYNSSSNIKEQYNTNDEIPIPNTENLAYVDLQYETTTIVDGSEYILSFEAKANKEGAIINSQFYSPNTTTSVLGSQGQSGIAVDGKCSFTLTTEWKKYWVKWKQGETNEKKDVIVARNLKSSNGLDCVVYVRNAKLEQGNKATAWTPAPEDVDAAIEKAEQDAADAKASADIANAQLDAIDNDNVIAISERAALETQLEQIEGEYNEIVSDMERNNLDPTSYEKAADKAIEALQYHCGKVYDGTNTAPINADKSITIVAGTSVGYGYGNISAYYTARQTALESIAAAVKASAEQYADNAAQNAADEATGYVDIYTGGNKSHNYSQGDSADIIYLCNISSNAAYITSVNEDNGSGGSMIDPFGGSCLIAWDKGAGFPVNYYEIFDFGINNVYGVYRWGDTINCPKDAQLLVCLAQYDYISSSVKNNDMQSIEYPRNGTWTLNDIKVYTNNALIAQAAMYKAEGLDYLKTALEDGSTEIAGGLTMTNVLMLKNLAGSVTAGMSGLTKHNNKEDKVLMWGGGTYEEAYAAANSDNYYKSGTTPITTLLKKDGTGKIGAFWIDKDTVKVVSGEQTTFITNKSISDVVSKQSTMEISKATKSYSSSTNKTEGSTTSYNTIYSKSFSVTKGKYALRGNLSVDELEAFVVGTSTPYTNDFVYAQAYVGGLRIRVVQNGVTKATLTGSCTANDKWYGYANSSYPNGQLKQEKTGSITSGKIEDSVSGEFELSAGTAYIYIEAIYYGRANLDGKSGNVSYVLQFSYDAKLLGLDKYSVIAKDGIGIIANSDAQFYVENSDSSKYLRVIANGLPVVKSQTMLNSLSRGQLYLEGGSLKIKT